MSEGIVPEIVLNEFGELSRKARRELLAKGIDPDTAVIEHIRTQSIPIISPEASTVEEMPRVSVSDEVVADEVLAEIVVEETAVESSFPVFAPTLSRRDVRNLRERTVNTTDIPVVRADEFHAAATRQDDDALAIPDAVVSAEIADSSDETHATAAQAIGESIASRRKILDSGEVVIDYREDLSEVTRDYEPFSISTMSTQSTGIIPTTGSALILPTLPENAPGARASFNHTGEILITGSIMLPSGIGHYGADVLSLDTSEIDLISDDEEVSSSQDLAPVSASSAVSSYNTSNTVVTVPSKFRDRLPLILAITAAGLAVGVVALFITGYVLGVF